MIKFNLKEENYFRVHLSFFQLCVSCAITSYSKFFCDVFVEKLIGREISVDPTARLTTSYRRESDVWLEIDAKQAPRIFLPTITRDKNPSAFQSRELAFGPRMEEFTYKPIPSYSIILHYYLQI